MDDSRRAADDLRGRARGFRRLPINRMNQNYLHSDLDGVLLFPIFWLDTYTSPVKKVVVFSDDRL